MLYKKITSIKQKILLTVGGSTALLLGLAAVIGVNHIANQTEAQVQAQVNSLMRKEAVGVGQFFAEYAQVAKTFLHNPKFQQWFENYPGRGTELNGLAGYEDINNTFKTISGMDSNIHSAFFALDRTAEYFREDSRDGVDKSGPNAGKLDQGYFATKRPWYIESQRIDKFFVGSPSADLTTGVVSAVVESTIYSPNGKLLGVGGLDLNIGKIGDIVDGINYQGEGLPFLLDSLGQVVHFSKKSGVKIEITIRLTISQPSSKALQASTLLLKLLGRVNQA